MNLYREVKSVLTPIIEVECECSSYKGNLQWDYKCWKWNKICMNNSTNKNINRIWVWDIVFKYEIKLFWLYKEILFTFYVKNLIKVNILQIKYYKGIWGLN